MMSKWEKYMNNQIITAKNLKKSKSETQRKYITK